MKKLFLSTLSAMIFSLPLVQAAQACEFVTKGFFELKVGECVAIDYAHPKNDSFFGLQHLVEILAQKPNQLEALTATASTESDGSAPVKQYGERTLYRVLVEGVAPRRSEHSKSLRYNFFAMHPCGVDGCNATTARMLTIYENRLLDYQDDTPTFYEFGEVLPVLHGEDEIPGL